MSSLVKTGSNPSKGYSSGISSKSCISFMKQNDLRQITSGSSSYIDFSPFDSSVCVIRITLFLYELPLLLIDGLELIAKISKDLS